MLTGCAIASLATVGITPAFAERASDDKIWTPLQISLWPPYQIPDENCTVYGVSLGVVMVGVHTFVDDDDYLGRGDDDVIGLQICGLFGFARGLCGLQMSVLGNDVDNTPCGLQVAGLFNYVEHDMGFGFQVACLWNRYDAGAGLQLAIVNEVDTECTGIQVGLFNWGGKANKNRLELINLQSILRYGSQICHQQGVDDMRGIQLGLINKASDMYGIQCGLLWNNAKCARGIQLGLVNRADSLTGLQLGLVNIIKENTVPFLPIFNASF